MRWPLLILLVAACKGEEPRQGLFEPPPRAKSSVSTLPTPTPAISTPPIPTARTLDPCGDFVSFAFGCGIGRPDPDPTVDIGTQANNELIVRQALVARCQQRLPPYDEGLLACFSQAKGDCAGYRTCADSVVGARPRNPP